MPGAAGVRSPIGVPPAPARRWRATPPPGTPPARRVPRARPYQGPPSYGDRPPEWGFPALVWQALPGERPARGSAVHPEGRLRAGALAAGLCAGVAVLAAGAEVWRYVLLLRGRREVLPGTPVAVSDALVVAAGWTALLLAVVTVLLLVPALVQAHAAAARRRGRGPARRPAAVLARLVVPVWNLYGAGQVLAEIDRTLAAPGGRDAEGAGAGDSQDADGRDGAEDAAADGRADATVPVRTSRWVTGWWVAWIVDAVLVVVTLGRAFGGSLQAVADTVELHVAVDVVAAVVAALTAVVATRFATRLDERTPRRLARWQVAPPAPTSERGRAEAEPVVAGSTGA
ncbi:DUF4328 domain-containing protein [Nakamurella endophytica]|uniref:DUF4328 domain-containing protein n=1 Tax=Nakamurella endophytica TaxID=1748367 RepID=UPI00166AC97B|nr:DUF4328 domain-containing protein [Nakamurella endophytica]